MLLPKVVLPWFETYTISIRFGRLAGSSSHTLLASERVRFCRFGKLYVVVSRAIASVGAGDWRAACCVLCCVRPRKLRQIRCRAMEVRRHFRTHNQPRSATARLVATLRHLYRSCVVVALVTHRCPSHEREMALTIDIGYGGISLARRSPSGRTSSAAAAALAAAAAKVRPTRTRARDEHEHQTRARTHDGCVAHPSLEAFTPQHQQGRPTVVATIVT